MFSTFVFQIPALTAMLQRKLQLRHYQIATFLNE